MATKRILAEYTFVGAFAATIVLALSHFVDGVLFSADVLWLPAWVIRIAAGTGAFILLFRVLTWAYLKYVWQTANAEEYLGGDWTYTYTDPEDGRRKGGYVQFKHTIEGISAAGYTKEDSDGGTPEILATWKATAASLVDRQLVLAVQLTGGSSGAKQGFVILCLVPRPRRKFFWPQAPHKLVGHYFLVGGTLDHLRYVGITFTRDEASVQSAVRSELLQRTVGTPGVNEAGRRSVRVAEAEDAHSRRPVASR